MASSRSESKAIGRGNLIYNEPASTYFFVFDGDELRTCTACKTKLGINCYVCEMCNKPYCYDCVKNYEGCTCYLNQARDSEYIKAVIKEGEK